MNNISKLVENYFKLSNINNNEQIMSQKKIENSLNDYTLYEIYYENNFKHINIMYFIKGYQIGYYYVCDILRREFNNFFKMPGFTILFAKLNNLNFNFINSNLILDLINNFNFLLNIINHNDIELIQCEQPYGDYSNKYYLINDIKLGKIGILQCKNNETDIVINKNGNLYFILNIWIPFNTNNVNCDNITFNKGEKYLKKYNPNYIDYFSTTSLNENYFKISNIKNNNQIITQDKIEKSLNDFTLLPCSIYNKEDLEYSHRPSVDKIFISKYLGTKLVFIKKLNNIKKDLLNNDNDEQTINLYNNYNFCKNLLNHKDIEIISKKPNHDINLFNFYVAKDKKTNFIFLILDNSKYYDFNNLPYNKETIKISNININPGILYFKTNIIPYGEKYLENFNINYKNYIDNILNENYFKISNIKNNSQIINNQKLFKDFKLLKGDYYKKINILNTNIIGKNFIQKYLGIDLISIVQLNYNMRIIPKNKWDNFLYLNKNDTINGFINYNFCQNLVRYPNVKIIDSTNIDLFTYYVVKDINTDFIFIILDNSKYYKLNKLHYNNETVNISNIDINIGTLYFNTDIIPCGEKYLELGNSNYKDYLNENNINENYFKISNIKNNSQIIDTNKIFNDIELKEKASNFKIENLNHYERDYEDIVFLFKYLKSDIIYYIYNLNTLYNKYNNHESKYNYNFCIHLLNYSNLQIIDLYNSNLYYYYAIKDLDNDFIFIILDNSRYYINNENQQRYIFDDTLKINIKSDNNNYIISPGCIFFNSNIIKNGEKYLYTTIHENYFKISNINTKYNILDFNFYNVSKALPGDILFYLDNEYSIIKYNDYLKYKDFIKDTEIGVCICSKDDETTNNKPIFIALNDVNGNGYYPTLDIPINLVKNYSVCIDKNDLGKWHLPTKEEMKFLTVHYNYNKLIQDSLKIINNAEQLEINNNNMPFYILNGNTNSKVIKNWLYYNNNVGHIYGVEYLYDKRIRPVIIIDK